MRLSDGTVHLDGLADPGADSPGGVALAADVPTYMEIFGRDLQAVPGRPRCWGPEFLRGSSLNVLSKLGASETNDWRSAQPGRIPHEIHTDPLSILNFRMGT